MDPRPLTDAFRTETEPTDLSAARVHARLRASATAPATARAPGRAWAFAAGLVVAGVPALLALVLLRGPAPTADPLETSPSVAVVEAPALTAAKPLDAVLQASGEPVALTATDGVALRYAGSGRLSGTAAAPRVEWSAGAVQVEVESGRGLDVRVATREAQVRVVGTGFTVTRDALGTAVSVSHGRVEVVCEGQPAVYLSMGEARTCLPVSAAGRLGRARTLLEGGADPATVLDEVRAARGLGATGVVDAELAFLELRLLVDLGRADEARTAAEAALAGSETARADEIRALLGSLEDR